MEHILTKDALYLLSYISIGNENYSSRFRLNLQALLPNFLKFFLRRCIWACKEAAIAGKSTKKPAAAGKKRGGRRDHSLRRTLGKGTACSPSLLSIALSSAMVLSLTGTPCVFLRMRMSTSFSPWV